MLTKDQIREKYGYYGRASRNKNNPKKYNQQAIKMLKEHLDKITATGDWSFDRTVRYMSNDELDSVAERLDLYALWLKDNPDRWYKGALSSTEDDVKLPRTGFCILGMGAFSCGRSWTAPDPDLTLPAFRKAYKFDAKLAFPEGGPIDDAFGYYVEEAGLVTFNDSKHVDIDLMTTVLHRHAETIREFVAQRRAGKNPSYAAIAKHTFWRQRKTAGLVRKPKALVKKGK